MRIADQDRDIERIGLTEQGAFSIRATGKAFRVLSSNLYRDKIAAIIRELCCNAADSHVAAGRADIPFKVSLPNALSPVFAVRDFGTGLSHKQIMGLYTTYFESTKTRSDDFIGALGLGSKSPFAYTDSFTVSAFDGRWRRDYCAFIAEDGTPSIALLSRVRDKEKRGLMVTVPVPSETDHANFICRAAVLLGRFNPAPVVGGVHGDVIAPRPVILEGDGWRICKQTKDFSSQGIGDTALALMGPVAYPIASAAVNDPLAQKIADLRGLEVEFPIGSLDITAGREELSYDGRTQRRLNETLRKVSEGFEAAIQRTLDTCATEFEAKRAYGALFSLPMSRQDGLFFRGKRMESTWFEVSFRSGDYPGLLVVFFEMKEGKPRIARTFYGSYSGEPFHIPTDALVYDNNLPRGGKARMLVLRQQTAELTRVIMVDGPPEQRRRFLDSLEGFPVKRTTELPPTRRVVAASLMGTKTATAYTLRALSSLYHGKIKATDWMRATVPVGGEPPAGALLLPLNNLAPVVDGKRQTRLYNLFRAVDSRGLLLPGERIWGATEAQTAAFKADGWTMFWPTIRTRATFRLLSDTSLARRMGQNLAARKGSKDLGLTPNARAKLRAVALALPKDHPLREVASRVRDNGFDADFHEWSLLAMFFRFELARAAEIPTVRDEREVFEHLCSNYRLLRPLLDTFADPSDLTGYIQMVDEKMAASEFEKQSCMVVAA